MLTESQARHLFAEAGAEISPRPAPVDDLVRGGRRLGRIRRGLQVGGVLAAVALIVAVGLVWRQDPAAPAADVAVSPQAPPGTRLVGMGRVAVAVPEGWGTNAVDCDGHTAQRESVVFDSEGVRLCDPPAHVDVSSLHIVESSSDWAKSYLSDAQPAGEVDGVPIARVSTREDGARFAGALVAESEDVVMWVLSPDAGVVDEILDSVVIVPDGYVTVPVRPNLGFDMTKAAMNTAGLSVELVEQFKPGWSAGSLISSDPPLGSVVPVGSTVTLVVTGEPSPDIPIATSDWRPGDAFDGAETGGVLRARDDGCLHVNIGPQALDVVWPAGYTAERTSDGTIVVMRPDGEVVAQTGRPFEAGGGFGSAPEGMPCRVNPDGDVMFVQGLLPPLSVQGLVPDLIGLDKEQALAELRALGLEPSVGYRPPEADNLVGTVVAQAPEPGSEADPGATVEVVVAAPVSVPGPFITAEDRRLADEMFDLARSPSVDTAAAVPFTPQVRLGLADQLLEQVDRSVLSDPSEWQLRLYGFRAYVGPFSALDLLRDSRGSYDLSLGQHPACVGDAVQPPAPLSDLRQVSIQPGPGETDSCLDWWSVDLFVDRDGQVAGVTLDLYEP